MLHNILSDVSYGAPVSLDASAEVRPFRGAGLCARPSDFHRYGPECALVVRAASDSIGGRGE